MLTRRNMLFSTAAVLAATAVPAFAQEAAGVWVGVLEPEPGTRLQLVMRIRRDDAGALGGMMDVRGQASGLLLSGVTAEAGRLAFSVPVIAASYAGAWDEASKSWKGEWSQRGGQWPLSLAAPPQQAQRLPPADWSLPTDEAIAKLIADRNAPRPGQGIVVGVVGPEGRRFVAGGTGAGAGVDRDTLFEIGSITKAFTAMILADMVNKGEVSLDDPAAKYLPAGRGMPQRGRRQITLRDLALHRSALPRMPDDIGAMYEPGGPFQDYTEEKMLAFLERYQLTRDIGSEWEYSNLGVGLLGYLLGRAAGSDYPSLVRARITGPLGMNDTVLGLPASHAARLAAPHDAYMRPVAPWEKLTVLTGAGGIRSTAADMLIFASALLDPGSPLAPAFRTALAHRAPSANPSVEQALGWAVAKPAPDREVVMHDGQTGGFQTMLMLEPAKGRAVTVLINSQVQPGPQDLARHILVGSSVGATPPPAPAPPPIPRRTEITLPNGQLDKFVGRYQFPSGFAIAVTLNGGRLYVQNQSMAAAPVLPIAAEAPLAFFWKDMDAQLRFTADADGAVTGAELIQSGQAVTGGRRTP